MDLVGSQRYSPGSSGSSQGSFPSRPICPASEHWCQAPLARHHMQLQLQDPVVALLLKQWATVVLPTLPGSTATCLKGRRRHC